MVICIKFSGTEVVIANYISMFNNKIWLKWQREVTQDSHQREFLGLIPLAYITTQFCIIMKRVNKRTPISLEINRDQPKSLHLQFTLGEFTI